MIARLFFNLQLAMAGKSALVGTFAYDADTEKMQISAGYAAIYGFPDGTTEISCRQWQLGVQPDDLVRWDELRDRTFRERSSISKSSVVPVREPIQPGYGTSIIRELIPYELDGTAVLNLGASGLRCRLEIPTDWSPGLIKKTLALGSLAWANPQRTNASSPSSASRTLRRQPPFRSRRHSGRGEDPLVAVCRADEATRWVQQHGAANADQPAAWCCAYTSNSLHAIRRTRLRSKRLNGGCILVAFVI